MCGVAGFLWRPGAATAEAIGARLTAMTDAIRRRGPDSSGGWRDEAAGVALGHRRLAIVDLTEAGHQPMLSPSGRFALSYNGEIYNHADLRAALESEGSAPAWRGHSDTETLVAGFDAWGIEATLRRCVGMFAIAVWDRAARRLTLARDRMGEKPLYYGWQGDGAGAALLFGSELKALRAHPAFENRIDRGTVAQFMRHSYVGGEDCIFAGLRKVAPGGIVEIDHADPGLCAEPRISRYWSAADVAALGPDPELAAMTPEDATDALEALLLDAVGRQMMSDVPLGAFLSGGVDSSTIVALMQRLSAQPVRTYTIGFRQPRYDEAEHARRVAQHLGTLHTELYVGDDDLRAIVPDLPTLYDEPFADGSQIPTFMVARLARQEVTVALSGDGGDELFCGYDRYAQGARLLRATARIPKSLRAAAAAAVRAAPPALLDALLGPFMKTADGKEPPAQRLRRLADYAACDGVDDLHRALVSRWRDPGGIVRGGAEPPTTLDALAPPMRRGAAPEERMMLLDVLAYLPDDILAKVDRATMGVSLESRAPLLDHRIVEFALRAPLDLKRRDGRSKWLLRQVLYRHVPPALIERPKMGFESPVSAWLRGPLRDWADDLLAPARLEREGFFDVTEMRRVWDQHQSGRWTWGLQLWNAVMFQSWLAGR